MIRILLGTDSILELTCNYLYKQCAQDVSKYNQRRFVLFLTLPRLWHRFLWIVTSKDKDPFLMTPVINNFHKYKSSIHFHQLGGGGGCSKLPLSHIRKTCASHFKMPCFWRRSNEAAMVRAGREHWPSGHEAFY